MHVNRGEIPLSEEIQSRLQSFQSRLSTIKSNHDKQKGKSKISRTQKKLAKEVGGAVGDFFGSKQWGKTVASNFIEGSQKQQKETIESDCLQSIDSLIDEIKSFLSGVSIFYKTNPRINSDKIIKRFKRVEGRPTCQGRIGRISEILASLQSKELIYNTELEKIVAKKRKHKPIPRTKPDLFQVPAIELIRMRENERIEFKSTLRWDIKEAKINKDLEYAAVRTLAGFMNAHGGVLLIGVEDDGTVRGIQEDLKTLGKKNCDGFELHLRQVIERLLGKVKETLVLVRFEKVDELDVCIVCTSASEEPVFLKPSKGKKEFPVRLGNRTKSLDVEETADYILKHWSK
jgi:hypothetical protein